MPNETISHHRIRRGTPADSDALYEICLLTADSGADASALYSNRKLPGYLWAAAYGALAPDFAFLLAECVGEDKFVAKFVRAFFNGEEDAREHRIGEAAPRDVREHHHAARAVLAGAAQFF